MILYVSGPMSFRADTDYNFPAFNEAAEALRDAGHIAINPAENWGGTTQIPRATCMRLDIQQVCISEGLAMLDDWLRSSGARLEHRIAVELGLDIRPWKEWL